KARAKPKAKSKQAEGPTGPLGLRVEGLGFKQRMDKLRAELKKEMTALQNLLLDMPPGDDKQSIAACKVSLEACWE
ncbi:unnamed protein product, partial [Effrenium voratum]